MNGLNRVIWVVIGACLTAAGVLGLLATRGWVAAGTIDDGLPFLGVWDRWRGIDWTDGALWILLGAAVVAAIVAVVLLVLELRPPARRPGGIEVDRTPQGRTVMTRRAVERLARRAVEGVPGVLDVQDARIVHDGGGAPAFAYRLVVDGERRVPEVGRAAAERAAAGIRHGTGGEVAGITTVVDVAAAAQGRVDRDGGGAS